MSASDDKTHLGAKVSTDLKQRVRMEAAREGMTISEYVRVTLDEVTK